QNTVVRNNVIAANGSASNADTGGILIGFRDTTTDSAGTVVAGNDIGVGADGATNLGNRNYGVVLLGRAVNTTIGGPTAADRNVIAGNAGYGALVSFGGPATIQGNYIGTNAAGSAAVPNTSDGVRIAARGSTGGGKVSVAGNVISGNGGAGIFSSRTDVLIRGNYLGVGADGLTGIGNQRGIFMDNPTGTQLVTIGGAGAGARNVISGNTLHGIDLFGVASGALVQGNFIGTDASGGVGVGNGYNGVQINGGGHNPGLPHPHSPHRAPRAPGGAKRDPAPPPHPPPP